MKIQTKLTALLLTLPIAYAIDPIDLSGSIDETFSSVSLTTPPSIDNSGYTEGLITLDLDSNTTEGWIAKAKSANGSMFALQDGDGNVENYATADGKNLQYDISCKALAASETNREAIAAISNVSLDTVNAFYSISTETAPSYPSTGSIACSIDLVAEESVEELFSGTYAEEITLSISNL